jgi:hypothetical protein
MAEPARKRAPLVTFTRRPPHRRSPNEHLWEGHDDKPNPSRPVNHAAALQTTTFLAEVFLKMHKPRAARVEPLDLIEVLNKAKVRFVLMGAHGIAGWLNQARGTRDVDVVVGKRDHKKAIRAIERAYPHLVKDEQAVVTRFRDPIDDEVVIDVMRPYDLYSAAFRNAVTVGTTYRVPNLELALAAKFAAMIAPQRERAKRLQDAADFIQMAKRNFPRIDRPRLASLGELVYAGGGDDLLKFLDDAFSDRNLRL